MRIRVLLLLAILILFIPNATAESLLDLYRYADSDVIQLGDNLSLQIADPQEILCNIQSEDSTHDLYIISLQGIGYSALLNTLPGLSLDYSTSGIPNVLQHSLLRNGKLCVFPLDLKVYPISLLSSSDSLQHYGIDAAALPNTLLSFFDAATTWYNTGILSDVNLIHHYSSPEMLIYYALQQYSTVYSSFNIPSEVSEKTLQDLLLASLQLATIMENCNAFDSSISLFTTPAANTGFCTKAYEDNILRLNECGLVGEPFIHPIVVDEANPISGYIIGTVALVNPNTQHTSEVLSLLSKQNLSETTLLYLHPDAFLPTSEVSPSHHANFLTALPTLTILSENMTELSSNGVLLEYATLLWENTITVEDCIHLLVK